MRAGWRCRPLAIICSLLLFMTAAIGLPGRPLLRTAAAAETSFRDDFSATTLDPAWQSVAFTGPRAYDDESPANHYSLTGNPGHLRYYLDPMTHLNGFLNGYQPYLQYYNQDDYYIYDPGLELYRTFSGEHWLFEAKASYYMPYANGRSSAIRVYFGDGNAGTYYATFERWRDGPFPAGTPETTPVLVKLMQKYGSTLAEISTLESVSLPPSPGDTYYLRLRRAAGTLTASWSPDGTAWSQVFSRDMGTALAGLAQRAVITGQSWFVPADSHADYDYVSLEVTVPGAFGKAAPANAATGQPTNPTLSWGTSSGATRYEYCFDTSNDNGCSIWRSTGTLTSARLGGLASSTTYYWQVRAVNDDGTTYADGGQWWSFTTASLPLAEALDQPGWTFSTGGDSLWQGTNIRTYDGSDAAVIDLSSPAETSWLETSVTGPGYVSFWWLASVTGYPGSGRISFFVDNRYAPLAEYGSDSWQKQNFALGAGPHTLRWVAESHDSTISAYLDQVSFSVTVPQVEVQVSANVPVTIAVDRQDIAGNQNGAIPFTRRYWFSTSAQVRFAAPLSQGAWEFDSWSGCDATEGAGGEVCIAGLDLDTGVWARYRPNLPEALDQPGWEFTTAGDAAWVGAASSGHEGDDGAQLYLGTAAQAARIETVQTLEAGFISFWWVAFTGGSAGLRFYLDDMSTPLAETGGGVWRQWICPVSAGRHTLRWVASSGDSVVTAYLDRVAFSSTDPEVAVRVGATRTVTIAVDRLDLGGLGNGTAVFTRRYTYDPVGRVRFTAPLIEGSHEFTAWTGCDQTEGDGGEVCVVSLGASRSITAGFRPNLAEALDQPSWVFTASGGAVWTGEYTGGYPSGDSARCTSTVAGQTAQLETVRTLAAGYLSFWWKEEYPSAGRIRFFLDDVPAPLAEYGGSAWQQRILPIPAGTHRLRWTTEQGEVGARARLDGVGFSTAIPEVTMAVSANRQVAIQVSAPDLVGLQHGTPYFTRRYAYDPAGEVRFTAPLLQGSDEFTAWSGCDRTEGVVGEVCAVSLGASRSVSVSYGPTLAEALDQPDWQFAAFGDAAWAPALGSGYENGDAACVSLERPGQVAYLETLRTFEAGYLTFWLNGSASRGGIQLFVDDMAAPVAEWRSLYWRQPVIPIPAGRHLLRWAVASAGGTAFACLDKVAFASVAPAIAIRVEAGATLSVPTDIAVDTMDLGGRGDGVTPFTRHYAYDPSGQVRFTAPLLHDSTEFGLWPFCDATEGARGETCVVGLSASRGLVAYYRPTLPEALDQPSWVFVTGGAAPWVGKVWDGYDGDDAASCHLEEPGVSALVQTERSLGSGYLSFWWYASGLGGGKIRFFLDDMSTPRVEYGGAEWRRQIVPVSAGRHTLRWVAASGEGEGTAYLDQLVFSTEPPAVSITVSSDYPSIPIGVDKTDLDGRRDGETVFSRRYPFDPAGQVRFAARPALDVAGGRALFNGWTGCDSTEGADGTVCVVSQVSGRILKPVYRATRGETVPLPAAVDREGWSFLKGGASEWVGQSAVSHDGEDAGMSGGILHEEATWFETSGIFPAGQLRFWWKVSSEAGFDHLSVYLDDTASPLARISGEVDWQEMVVPVEAGQHTVRWEYAKDDLMVRGLDAAWVDQIRFTTDNSPPVAVWNHYGAAVDSALTIGAPGVLGNDTDADAGDTLAAVRVSEPAHGTLALGADGSFVYTPAASFTGHDRFTYRASDGRSQSNTAEVTISVDARGNAAPVAVADSWGVAEDAVLDVAARGVLDNDRDADGDTLYALKVTDPAHGTVALRTNGSFRYVPHANFSGVDSFTYRLSDGQAASDAAAVTITVTEADNDAPVLGAPGDATVEEGRRLSFTLTASDPEGQPLTYGSPALPPGAALDAGTGAFAWTPGYDQAGSHPVTFTVSDGQLTDSRVVSITVTDHDPLLFFEDFGNGTARGDPQWVRNAGLWKVDARKRYRATSTARTNLSTVRKAFLPWQTAVRVESRVMLATPAPAGPNAMLVFGWQGLGKYRCVQLTRGELRLVQVGSFGGNGAKVYARKKVTAVPGRSYLVRVDAYAGGRVRVYLDGKLKIDARFRKAMPGALGVGAVRANALFDDFRVRDATVLP